VTVEVEPTEASATRSRIALLALGVIAAAVWIALARLAVACWR